MRITRKLAILVTVPLIAVVAFAGWAVSTSAGTAGRAELLRQLVQTGAAAGELTRALQAERAAAVLLLTGGAAHADEQYHERVTDSRAAAQIYQQRRAELPALSSGAAQTLARLDTQLSRLDTVREQVTAGRGAASITAFRYRVVIADLVTFREQLAQAGAAPAEVADRMRAAAAVSQAAEYVGRQQLVVLRAADHGVLTPSMAEEIVAVRSGFTEAALVFDNHARAHWRGWWERAAIGHEVLAAQQLADQAARTEAGARLRVDPQVWTSLTDARVARLQQVRSQVDTDLIAEVTGLRDGARRLAVAHATGAAVAVAVAVVLAVWLGRPVLHGLRELRDAARTVAYEQLPAAVAQLDDHAALGDLTPEQFADRLPAPVAVAGRDEIAEVGEAFNAVHREAVRVAADQAMLRLHVAAMFINLARRGQSLAGRLTAALDEAERDEQDPVRLRHLFTVDHLVTLLGRINDSLLVLGGAVPAQVRTTDESLPAVVTAAQGQVEGYTRVVAGLIDDGVQIRAQAVDDVVKLLAELIDNGCRFAPPPAEVLVDGRRLADRVLIQVSDVGIGIEPQRLRELNERLASRPTLDLAAVRTMGLTVVGHLAARWGIRVELRPGYEQGTIAEVTLPPAVFTVATPARPPMVVSHRQPPRPTGLLPEPTTPVRLAIFEQVRSGWFDTAVSPPPTPATPAAPSVRATAPVPSGLTGTGLPVRRPGAQLVPDSPPVDRAVASASASEEAGARWRNPARVAAVLSAYARGLATGRASSSQSHPQPDGAASAAEGSTG